MKAPFQKLITVYGGQYGSEGKGQILRHLAGQLLDQDIDPRYMLAYRVGAVNAGHTFYTGKYPDLGKKVVTCQLPGPMFLNPYITGILGPEALISMDVMTKELETLVDLNKTRPSIYPHLQTLLIDKSVTVVPHEYHDQEHELVKDIGSTGKGIGIATANKALRNGSAILARDYQPLLDLLDEYGHFLHISFEDTIEWLYNHTAWIDGYHGLLEGTQGTGLSLHTSGHYPFCTSRECTPQGIWAGAGLHPDQAKEAETIMVIRTYPIRVAGNSGPMRREISWETISERCGRPVTEQTTVTKKTRRISEIDVPLLRRAVHYTRPTSLAVTFMDYLGPNIHNTDPNESLECRQFIDRLEHSLETPVSLVSSGEGAVFPWIH